MKKSKARGLDLEKIINSTNLVYRKQGVAVIVKSPTPFLITNKGLIPQQAITDYIGCYKSVEKSIPIAFDAKETANKTSFPFGNIKDHQLLFLNLWNNVGGLAFLLIHFTSTNEYYKLPVIEINKILETGKKSIKKTEIEKFKIKKIEDYLELL